MTASTPSQRGSVFFYVLIAVVVFAALSYAIASSLRGNEAMSDQRLKLVASDIIGTGNSLAEAVMRLRMRGVASTEISFQNDLVTGYTNADCSSGSCKVFDHAGGGLSPPDVPPGAQATALPWIYTGGITMGGIGTAAADLVAFVPVTIETCIQIDRMLDMPLVSGNPPPMVSVPNVLKFTGTYASSPATITAGVTNRKKSGCIRILSTAGGTAFTGVPAGSYYFYQVLISN